MTFALEAELMTAPSPKKKTIRPGHDNHDPAPYFPNQHLELHERGLLRHPEGLHLLKVNEVKVHRTTNLLLQVLVAHHLMGMGTLYRQGDLPADTDAGREGERLKGQGITDQIRSGQE